MRNIKIYSFFIFIRQIWIEISKGEMLELVRCPQGFYIFFCL